jgi:hypothetical protein
VTIKTALRVKQIHPLIAPAGGKPEDNGDDEYESQQVH